MVVILQDRTVLQVLLKDKKEGKAVATDQGLSHGQAVGQFSEVVPVT